MTEDDLVYFLCSSILKILPWLFQNKVDQLIWSLYAELIKLGVIPLG